MRCIIAIEIKVVENDDYMDMVEVFREAPTWEHVKKNGNSWE